MYIEVLSDGEKQTIKEALRQFADASGHPDDESRQFAATIHEGEIGVNVFPMSTDGPGEPIDQIVFEVRIDATWHGDRLAMYNPENLRGGSDVDEALARELESAVKTMTGEEVAFIVRPGSPNVATAEFPI